MKGYIITYKPKDDTSRVKLNHDLFGRIIYRNYRGKKYTYYSPGILDEVRFFRLSGGKVFVEEEVNISNLKDLADIGIESAIRDEKELLLMTGKDYWKRIAKEKGLFFKEGKK